MIKIVKGWLTILDDDQVDDDWQQWENCNDKLEPLINKIANFTESQKAALPLICPTKDQWNVIYQRSFELEQALVPDYHQNGGKARFKESFEKFKARRKFCNIDMERAMKSNDVHEFFHELAEDGRKSLSR